MTNEETTLVLLEQLQAKVDALQVSLQPPEYYSIKQAAKVIDVSPDHIRRAVLGGILPASNIGTTARPTYRIARIDLLAWVGKRKSRGNSPGIPQEKKLLLGVVITGDLTTGILAGRDS